MNERLPEKKEFEIAEAFERGERQRTGDTDNRILQAYLSNRERLRQIALPAFDANQLARKLEAKAGSQNKTATDFLVWRFIQPLAWGFSFVVVLFLLWIPLWGNPIDSIQWNDTTHTASGWWKFNLQSGRTVTIPKGTGATIRLADRSIVECRPGTRLAIRYGNTRSIRLDTGLIRIQAVKDAQHPMMVETPLGNAKVVGTVFTIEVIP